MVHEYRICAAIVLVVRVIPHSLALNINIRVYDLDGCRKHDNSF